MDVGITWHTDREDAGATAAEVVKHGQRAAVTQLDLGRLPKDAEAIDRLADELGAIDVLVNGAGTDTSTPFLDLEYDTVRHVLDVDLLGPFLCSQRAARRMIAQGTEGRIVNITSVHEHQPRVGAGPYCAAKGGLGLLTQVMALELAEHGITVNAVAPGEIATPMTGQEDADVERAERPGIPLGRPGDAARSRRSSLSWPARTPLTPPVPHGWSTAACSAWGHRPDHTCTTTDGAAPGRGAPGREARRRDDRDRLGPTRDSGPVLGGSLGLRRAAPQSAVRRYGSSCRNAAGAAAAAGTGTQGGQGPHAPGPVRERAEGRARPHAGPRAPAACAGPMTRAASPPYSLIRRATSSA
jgi:NAD(P)-dependent dehydrogenase (short-subunit alcohol dehydrogenase family)